MNKFIQFIITALLLIFTVLECIALYPCIKDGLNLADNIYILTITALSLISFIFNLIYFIRLSKKKSKGDNLIVNCLILALISILFNKNFVTFKSVGLTEVVKRNFLSEAVLLFFSLISVLMISIKCNITINSRKKAKIFSIIILILVIANALYKNIPLLIESIKNYRATNTDANYINMLINIITIVVIAIALLSLVFVLLKRQRFIVLSAIIMISYEFSLIANKALSFSVFDNNTLIEFGKYLEVHVAICLLIRVAIAIAKSKETRREI